MGAMLLTPFGEVKATLSTDLGGSSKHSSKNLEGQCGERFLGNSIWPRVSRS